MCNFTLNVPGNGFTKTCTRVIVPILTSKGIHTPGLTAQTDCDYEAKTSLNPLSLCVQWKHCTQYSLIKGKHTSTTAYSPLDWDQWGFLLTKVNYLKNGSIDCVLPCRQVRSDMHFMVHGQCTTYECN